MDKHSDNHRLIEETLCSLDHIQRATPAPYLLTRIQQRLNKTQSSFWEKASWFIGRPSFAIPGLLLLLTLNISAILLNNNKTSYPSVTEQAASDDFTVTVATIYEIENIEP